MRISRFFRSIIATSVFLLATSVFSLSMAKDHIKITGAGASFPAPLYQRWFRDYFSAHPDVRVDYQAIGSGAGIENFIGSKIDFAGSDLPLGEEKAGAVEGGVVQVPLAAGAVVMAYHLDGFDGLKLSREAISGIFLGKVQRWNDRLIAEANAGVVLPDLAITLVARSDSSGTTFVTTRHLSAIDEQFEATVGDTMTPVWPETVKKRGAIIRGRGNGGVAAYIRAIPGSIGYVQFAYAHLTNLQAASLQNQTGEYVAPNSASFKAAIESFKANLDPLNIADPGSPGAYPILSLSWIIARKNQDDKEKAEAFKKVIRYCLTDGQETAALLGYIPLTEQAVEQILGRIGSIQ